MPFKDPDTKRKYHREYYHLNLKEQSRERYRLSKEADPLTYMLKGARNRAKRRGLAFNITKEDISLPETCPALGIHLAFQTGGFKDNSPSLDRIDNSKGYVKGNVQVLSYKANAMKSSATFEEVEKLYLFMKNQKNASND